MTTRLDLIRSINPFQIAEVGVLTGDFSAELLTIPSITSLHLVDPWQFFPGEYEKDPANVSQEGQDQRYRDVCERFTDNHKVTIHRTTSLLAAGAFGINAFSCVFIDGQHDYDSVMDDLSAWSMVAPILFVHDYTDSPEATAMGFGVKPAVKRFCQKYGWTINMVSGESDWPTAMLVER